MLSAVLFQFPAPLYSLLYGGGERGPGGDRVERRSRPRSRLRHRRRRPVVDGARIRHRAENHRPAAVRRARRSPGRHAGFRGLPRRGGRHGDRNRGVERAGLRLEPPARSTGWPASPMPLRCPTVLSTAPPCSSRSRGAVSARSPTRSLRPALDPLKGPRRQPRDPLYGAAQKLIPSPLRGADNQRARRRESRTG